MPGFRNFWALGSDFKKGDYLIADPEKSLVDYLYFVALGKKEPTNDLT